MTIKPWPINNKIRPTLPHVKGSDTSKAAAESMEAHARPMRERVFEYIKSQGEHGATDDEIEVALGMSHQSCSPRRRELEKDDAIYLTDDRRKTRSGRRAGVYRVVEGATSIKKVGRPPKRPSNALTVKMTVYLTKGQDLKLARLARIEGRTKAAMARMCLGAGYERIVGVHNFSDSVTGWTDNG
jgi:hypothetical protein